MGCGVVAVVVIVERFPELLGSDEAALDLDAVHGGMSAG